MQQKRKVPLLFRILALILVLTVLISAVLFFTTNSWIPSAVIYGSVSVLEVLGAIEEILINKNKFLGTCFIILAIAFCLTLIQTLIRNINI